MALQDSASSPAGATEAGDAPGTQAGARDGAAGAFPPVGVRRFGRFNGLGVRTLCQKEVMRFVKVWSQTILAPMAQAVLFMVVFTAAAERFPAEVNGVSFEAFLIPGLVMMQVIQNAFANTSSSILVSKVQGNIVDVLMPPLSPAELTFSFAVGGVVRGLIVGVVAAAALSLLGPLMITHVWAIVFFSVMGSMALAFVGIIGGVWAAKFDHLATVQNFVIMPLAFLSGTFYSVERLADQAEWLYQISKANPVFYMIDGFRYGFTGESDGNVMIGVALLIVLNVILAVVCHRMFATGYKLKA
jgi:ABC-2 type transport system permease protein